MHMNQHNQDAQAKLKACDSNPPHEAMLDHRRGPARDRGHAAQMDVICGRGQNIRNHDGNRRFRKVVLEFYGAYSNAQSKKHKTSVVSSIINAVRMQDGNFVRMNAESGQFEKISERLAREKVGQELRDVLHTKYSSSTKAKKRKRAANRENQDEQIKLVVMGNAGVQAIMASLMEQLKLQGENCTEYVLGNMFLEANKKILQELKQSDAVGILAAATSPTNEPTAAPHNDHVHLDDDHVSDSDIAMV